MDWSRGPESGSEFFAHFLSLQFRLGDVANAVLRGAENTGLHERRSDVYSGESRRWCDQRVGLLERRRDRSIQRLDPCDGRYSGANLSGCRAGHHDFYGVASNRRIGPLAVRAKHAGDAYTRYGIAADFAVVDSATADSLDCSPADGGRIGETGIA